MQSIGGCNLKKIEFSYRMFTVKFAVFKVSQGMVSIESEVPSAASNESDQLFFTFPRKNVVPNNFKM